MNNGDLFNSARNISWYANTLLVDPNDENTVMVGGLNLFRSTMAVSIWFRSHQLLSMRISITLNETRQTVIYGFAMMVGYIEVQTMASPGTTAAED